MKLAILTTALLLLTSQLKTGNMPVIIATVLLYILWLVDISKFFKK